MSLLLHRHAQMAEHAPRVGIVRPVEDDEAGVDRNARAVIIDRDGAAVAADARRLLIDRDVVVRVEQIGRAQAGNARPDDRDLRHVQSAGSRLVRDRRRGGSSEWRFPS